MSLISCNCPHCHTSAVSFKSVAETIIENNVFTLFMVCNHCNKGICLTVFSTGVYSNGTRLVTAATPHEFTGELRSISAYSVRDIYPRPEKINAPRFLSPSVERCFLQGIDNINRDNFEASGAMFRKSLDVATRELGAEKGSLQSRINALADKNAITPAMKEWAHAIRLDGNEATHDEEPFDKETCEALQSFTELFLMYAFTLPGMLKERSAKKPS